MRYDHRSSRRGGGRQAPRRREEPRGRPGRQGGARRDQVEDDEYYDDLPPPSSNALPWIVVSILVIATFALVVVLAAGSGGDEEATTEDGRLRAPKGPVRLHYGSFPTTRYKVKYKHTRMTKTETADTPFNEVIRGYLTVSGGAGGGSATLDVQLWEAGSSRVVRPPHDCPANGRPISYTIGSQGGLSISERDAESVPTRVMLTALFPDLPDGAIDPSRGDGWVARSPEPLLALLPFPEPFSPSLKPFTSQLSADAPGGYKGKMCIKVITEQPLEVHGTARTTQEGEKVDALLDGSGSGSMILELDRGVPLHALADFKGKINVRPYMFKSVKVKFTYAVGLEIVE